MARPASRNLLKHLRASDLRGLAQLATQASIGVTRIAEGLHQSVWRSLGAPAGPTPEQTRGLTGLVYRGILGATRRLGHGVDRVLAGLQPFLESTDPSPTATPQREAVLAALNGVIGDHLAASDNPLATRMSLRCQGEVLNWQALPPTLDVGAKVLLLIHGLCMNDLQWRAQGGDAQALDHGAALAASLGYSAVYLRYNSGLHTSRNGHELAAQLEQLFGHWPTPIEDLTVLAHSMGGLLIRSAFYPKSGS